MAMNKFPSEADYWSLGILGQEYVSNTTSRLKFKLINKCLQVSNPYKKQNKDDSLAKVRPLLKLTQKNIEKHWIPGRNLGLDESQEKFGSRYTIFSFRCEKNKPLKDYIKIIACHDSMNGYLVSFIVDMITGMKVSQLLYDTLKILKKDNGKYKVATYLFYTTVDNCNMLLEKLGVYMYGTIRKDRDPH